MESNDATQNRLTKSRQRIFFAAILLALLLILVLTVKGLELQKKKRAFARFQELGAFLSYYYQWSATEAWRPDAEPPGYPFLKRLFGDHYAAEPVEIQLFAGADKHPEMFTDADAAHLSQFGELKWIVLQDTKLTNAGLEHFRLLKKLERVDADGTAVSEKGAEELKTFLPDVKIYYSN